MTGTIERATGRSDFRVAAILGSGLGDLAGELEGRTRVPFSEIGLPDTSVGGHEGALYAGDLGATPALFFAGRLHLYEGFDPEVVTSPARMAAEAGCDTLLLTNAAGGINPDLEVGEPCLISDHINLTGASPLSGPHFVDLSNAYDEELRARARTVDPHLQEGVYAGLRGPAYETPAEVRMLARLGADLVGMSTVLEAICARALGLRVLGIALVTNRAAGLTSEPLAHSDVAAVARRGAGRMEALVRGVLEGL